MLLGNDLLELIGTLEDPETVPGAEDDPDDGGPSAEAMAPSR